MPGYNRQGPLGEGPMTGRANGLCNNRYDNAEETTPNTDDRGEFYGRGQGRGGQGRRGLGRGGQNLAGRGFNRMFGGFNQGRNTPFPIKDNMAMQSDLNRVTESIDRLTLLAERFLTQSQPSGGKMKPGEKE